MMNKFIVVIGQIVGVLFVLAIISIPLVLALTMFNSVWGGLAAVSIGISVLGAGVLLASEGLFKESILKGFDLALSKPFWKIVGIIVLVVVVFIAIDMGIDSVQRELFLQDLHSKIK
jgi:hypothetical protein